MFKGQKIWDSYLRGIEGNVAIIFAITLLTLLAGVGVAVDINGLHSTHSKYQDSADAAVLAAARSGEQNVTTLTELAQSSLDNQFFNMVKPTLELNLLTGDEVQVVLTGEYQTYIMGMFGKKNLGIKAESRAPVAIIYPTQVALVLDTTASMSGSKLDDLKEAVDEFVDVIEKFSNGSVELSVMPFAQHINVGMSNRNNPWLDVEPDNTSTGTCYMTRDITSMTNCRPAQSNCVTDGTQQVCHTQICDYTYGPEYEYCPIVNDVWLGCVGSRNGNWEQRPSYANRQFPGLMNIPCGSEVLPMTTDLSTIRSSISGLVATGETYMPSGLMWGWRSLDTDQPFPSPSNASNVEKIMIVMTDGKNTRSKDGDTHMGTNDRQTDQKVRRICSAIKDDNIMLYTVSYDVNNASANAILRNCATEPENFYEASDASELTAVFNTIGNQLVELRLTR